MYSMSKAPDEIDCRIIEILERQGRSSISDVGKEVGLSAPAVGERLRSLQSNGYITGFAAQFDLRKFGYAIQALVRVKPRSGQLHIVERMIEEEDRFISCHRVTGDDCYVGRLLLKEISELDEILLPFHDRAETNTSIIKSIMFEDRLPKLEFGQTAL